METSAKIVVGIDFSEQSEIAARQALGVARHLGGELVLVHVRANVELPKMPERRTDTFEQEWRQRDVGELAAARDQLGQLRERLSGQGAVISQLLVEDYPDEGVCAAARELAARLTVVGTHGRTGLRWLQMGSVAQKIVRQSETDVLVARGVRREGYQRILVATDFSPSAERALAGAIALAAPRATIDLVHYLDAGPMLGGNFGASQVLSLARERMMEFARMGADDLLARKHAANLTLRFRVSTERPVPGIVHALELEHCDLVVLGSHGRRGIRRFLLGSVAENVVRHAPCSVLVAHGQPDVAPPAP